MEMKFFEVRDRMTLIPVLAIRLIPDNEFQRHFLGRIGFGLTADEQGLYVLVVKMETGQGQIDPYGWGSSTRTMLAAHAAIQNIWPTLTGDQVIDVEYLLGETDEPKASEHYAALPAARRSP